MLKWSKNVSDIVFILNLRLCGVIQSQKQVTNVSRTLIIFTLSTRMNTCNIYGKNASWCLNNASMYFYKILNSFQQSTIFSCFNSLRMINAIQFQLAMQRMIRVTILFYSIFCWFWLSLGLTFALSTFGIPFQKLCFFLLNSFTERQTHRHLLFYRKTFDFSWLNI